MRNPKILVLDRADTLAEQLRGATADARPRPDVTACTRVGSVGDVLTEDGPFDVLVAGPSLGTRAGLARLEVIHDELPAMSVLLAFNRRPEARLRDIVRTGAIDLLQLPTKDDDLLESVQRAIELSRQQSAAAPAQLAGGSSVGRVFTTSSATGGCGKTFYATNLAYFLTHYTGKRTCIVDLDLQFGEVSTALRLRPRFTIFDALQRDEEDESALADHIEEYLVKHDTGIYLLPAPKDPSEADRISPPDVTRIIEAIRTKFDYVIVDTPAALTEIVLAAFDLSDELFTLATLDLPSVRNMGVFLNTLDKLKIPADNISLILNKAEKDVGIDIEQITKLFPQGFMSVLPYAREVSKSINVGMPVMAFNPNAEVSRRITSGLRDFLPEDMR
ncbi:MAG: AAA family ATPase, partial [Acidimicrobiia bacterium]|nr:AAA family ATPase [Acidimicrobiia bacterium]